QKPSSENTTQVPPPEDHDSIFIEVPKPKAKKTVSEPNSLKPNSYQPKLPYPERKKVRENDKLNILFEADVLNYVAQETDVLNSVAQEAEYTEHLVSDNDSYNELTSGSNVILYGHY
ncbi:hypothetical protein Tco_1025381, partial [Tanacetum coccineum]